MHRLGCDLRGQAAVVVEQAHAPRDERAKWAEWLLEQACAASMFISRSGVLGLYAHARTSGLALDVGWSGVSITPVADGYPYMMGVQHVTGGAHAMDSALDAHLQAAGITWDEHGAQWQRGDKPSAPSVLPVPLLAASTRGGVQKLVSPPFPALPWALQPPTSPICTGCPSCRSQPAGRRIQCPPVARLLRHPAPPAGGRGRANGA